MHAAVSLDEGRGALAIIDQTLLPLREELIYLKSPEDIRDAIYELKVRGAPAIGAAAAIGAYLAADAVAKKITADAVAGNIAVDAVAGNIPADAVAKKIPEKALSTPAFESFLMQFRAAIDLLNSARPTAVNLSWALKRMERVAVKYKNEPLAAVVSRLKDECLAILDEDARVCEAIGKHGLELLTPGMGLLTHCNAGRLATASQYGTATAPIYLGHERGYGFKVYCGETRPLLQGARLTAYELCSSGVDATLFCDNMTSSLMSAGLIDAVLVGCDRVAANGDTANKIGTSYIAIAAKHYEIPFYVCAPSPTVDLACDSGESIVIEQRQAKEVTDMWYANRVAPDGIKVFNPSFDVTDAGLISAIITENGIARPPYKESLAALIPRT